jgi:hypothetical protein
MLGDWKPISESLDQAIFGEKTPKYLRKYFIPTARPDDSMTAL